MKKIILFALAASLIAAPALAMGTRPSTVQTDPVPRGALDGLLAENKALWTCIDTVPGRYAQYSATPESRDLALTVTSFQVAAMNNNNTAFQTEAATFHNQLAPLKARYGC